MPTPNFEIPEDELLGSKPSGQQSDPGTSSSTDPSEGELTDELKEQLTALAQKPEEQRSEEENTLLEKHTDFVKSLDKADPSSKDTKDQDTIDKINSILDLEEMTEEDENFLNEHPELTRNAMIERNPVYALMQEEGLVEEEFIPEPDINGIKEYLAKRDEKRDAARLQEFFKENVTIAALYDHLVNQKKPLDTFLARAQEPDVLKQQLKEVTKEMPDNEKAQLNDHYKHLISADLESKGLSKTQIDTILAASEKGGTLFQDAKASFTSLKNSYEAQIQQQEQQYLEQAREQEKQIQAIRDQATNIIKNNSFNGVVNIPDNERQAFIDFVTKPVDNDGSTASDLAYNKASLQEKVMLDWILFKKFKGIGSAHTTKTKPFVFRKKSNDSRKDKIKSDESFDNIMKNVDLASILRQQQ